MFARNITERAGRVCVNAQRALALAARARRWHAWPLHSRAGCGSTDHRSPITDHAIRAGFTLLELLLVIGIITMLLVLITPAFTSMKTGADLTNAVYGIQGVLEHARTYAKANHTYVFVGFAEVDSSVDPSVSPQVTTGDTPYGRVAMGSLQRRTALRSTNTLRPIRGTTGMPIMPMALILSPSGNYKLMRICILCRSILRLGLPRRIRTPKWHAINQPVRRTF